MEVWKGKSLMITAGSLTKIDKHDNFTWAVFRCYRDRSQREENPDHASNQSDYKIGYHTILARKIKVHVSW